MALAAWAGFAIGRYVVDDPQTAVFASLTPVALLGLGEVGGPLGRRLLSYAVAIALAAVAVCAGTLASEDTLAAAFVLFVGALLISQAGAAGPNALGLARPILLILVVAAGIPAPDSWLPDRLLGLAIGGLAVLAAARLLWPERTDLDYRERLARALDPLAATATDLAESRTVTRDSERAEEAIGEASPFELARVERPLGASAVSTAERILRPGLERVEELLGGVAERGDHAPAARRLLAAIGSALAGAAAQLRTRSDVAEADLAVLESARADYVEESTAALRDDLEHGRLDVASGARLDEVFRLRRLGRISTAVVTEARVAAGLGDALAAPGEPRPRTTRDRLADQVWIRFSPGSVLLHNALRLSLGLAAARLIAGEFDLQHGFWVVFATLTVTRATARGTGANALKAVLGTAAGAVLATALVLALEAEADVYIVLVPLFAFLASYGASVSFVLGQTGFTLMIVAIFNLVAPPEWNIGLIRLEDVLIGAAVGLAIGVAAWPRGPGAQLRQSVARAIDAGADFTSAAAARLLGAEAPRDLLELRREAVRAARRAEAVLVSYVGEVADPATALERWAGVLEQTHRLWYEAGVSVEIGGRAERVCPVFAEALERTAQRVGEGLHAVARAIESRSPPPPPPELPSTEELGRGALECAASARGAGEARLDATVRLLGARAWIAELGRVIDELGVAATGLAR